jgi:large conductance mechanosensitive channel
LFDEFKAFAMKGDLITIAVGLVMALALAAVLNALVANVLMPIVGIIIGEPSFDGLTWTVNDSVILYGSFITAVVQFLIIALAVFFFIVKPYQAVQARQKKGDEPPPEPSEEIVLLREIRDGLRR